MKAAKNIQPGQNLEHCNFGLVRVIQVTKRGVIVLQTAGREGFRRTTEHRVAKRDLYTA